MLHTVFVFLVTFRATHPTDIKNTSRDQFDMGVREDARAQFAWVCTSVPTTRMFIVRRREPTRREAFFFHGTLKMTPTRACLKVSEVGTGPQGLSVLKDR